MEDDIRTAQTIARVPLPNHHIGKKNSLLHRSMEIVATQVQPLGEEDTAKAREALIDSGVEDPKIRFEAGRRSIEFQLNQYRRYSRRVQESGIEPKMLLTGLEVAQSSQNAPPFEFWCLITVRDRIIVESNALLQQIRLEREEAAKSLGITSPIIAVLLSASRLDDNNLIPWASLLNISAVSYGLFAAARLAMTWRRESELQSIVDKAVNWELDEQHKGVLGTLWRYLSRA